VAGGRLASRQTPAPYTNPLGILEAPPQGRYAARVAAKPQEIADESALLPPELGDVTESQPTAEEILGDFFAERRDDEVRCSVYELSGQRHKDRSFLFSFPFEAGLLPADLCERILDTYGAGYYELFAQYQGGENHGRIVTRKVFRIGSQRSRANSIFSDSGKKPDAPETEKPKREAAGLSTELAAILENQNRMLERLIDAQSSRREPDILEMAEKFASLRQLFAPAPASPASEILQTVKDVLALKNELSDEGGESSPLSVALKQFGPGIMQALARANGEAGAVAPAPAPAPGQPRPNGDAAAEAMPMQGSGMFFDAPFDELLKHAQGNSEPPEVCEAVLTYLANQPQWIELAVLTMIGEERERSTSKIIAMYPKLGPHRDWLAKVVAELVQRMDEAEAAADDETDQPQAPASAGAPHA